MSSYCVPQPRPSTSSRSLESGSRVHSPESESISGVVCVADSLTDLVVLSHHLDPGHLFGDRHLPLTLHLVNPDRQGTSRVVEFWSVWMVVVWTNVSVELVEVLKLL